MHPTLINLMANERTEALRASAAHYRRSHDSRPRRRLSWRGLRAPRVAHA